MLCPQELISYNVGLVIKVLKKCYTWTGVRICAELEQF